MKTELFIPRKFLAIQYTGKALSNVLEPSDVLPFKTILVFEGLHDNITLFVVIHL